MTNKTLNITITVVVVVYGLVMLTTAIMAEDCPKGAPSCKVVVMTPEEIQTLTGPGQIYDQATWANRSGMTAVVEAWKKKIETSPNGTVSQREPGVKADEHK